MAALVVREDDGQGRRRIVESRLRWGSAPSPRYRSLLRNVVTAKESRYRHHNPTNRAFHSRHVKESTPPRKQTSNGSGTALCAANQRAASTGSLQDPTARATESQTILQAARRARMGRSVLINCRLSLVDPFVLSALLSSLLCDLRFAICDLRVSCAGAVA